MTIRSGLAGLLLVAAVTGVETGSGQQAPPAGVIRSGANAVLVDVYPQLDGRIVEGLTVDDFELLEDGKHQTIQTAEFVRIEGDPTPQPDPGGLREMYAAAANPRNRLFVFYLDSGHTTLDGSSVIAGPLADFMNHAVGSDDLMGLATPDIRPQDITFARDRYRIEHDLREFWSWGLRQRLTTNRRDPMEEALNLCFHDLFLPTSIEPWLVNDQGVQRYLDQLLIERRREERLLHSLTELVQYLGRLREARSTLLLMTDGWILYGPDRRLPEQLKRDSRFARLGGGGILSLFEMRRARNNPSVSIYPDCAAELIRLSEIDSALQLRELISLANRNNITFYPIATAGLAAFDNSMSERVTPTRGTFAPTIVTRDAGRIRNRVAAVRTLAENTDGIAIVQTNDLAKGLRLVADDVSSYYLLGYYPANQKMDGRYRRLEVKVRQPGLKIKARRGYVATPRNEAPREEPIPGSPDHVDRVAVALSTLPNASLRRDIHTRAARLLSGEIELVVELDSRNPPAVASAAVRVDLLPRNGPAMTAAGELTPGRQSATVRLPVQGQAGPWTAVIAMSYGNLLFRDRIEIQPEPPALVGDVLAFRSPASGTPSFSSAANMEFRPHERLRLAWPVTGQIDRSSARLLDRRGQPLLAAVPVADQRDQLASAERRLAVDLSLTSLAAGDYVLEMTASRGTQSEVRAVAFRVVR